MNELKAIVFATRLAVITTDVEAMKADNENDRIMGCAPRWRGADFMEKSTEIENLLHEERIELDESSPAGIAELDESSPVGIAEHNRAAEMTAQHHGKGPVQKSCFNCEYKDVNQGEEPCRTCSRSIYPTKWKLKREADPGEEALRESLKEIVKKGDIG